MRMNGIEGIKRNLFLRTLVALVFIGTVLVAAVLVPLRADLKKKNGEQVEFTAEAKAVAVNQFLSKISSVAGQIASRTQIRKKLEAWDNGKVSRKELVSFTAPILGDALKSSPDLLGIRRFDARGEAVATVGTPLPDGFDADSARRVGAVTVFDPVLSQGNPVLVVAAPITEGETRIGTDLVLFRTDNLRAIITDYRGLGRTGEGILAYARDGGWQPVFPTRRPLDSARLTALVTAPRVGASSKQVCPDCVVTVHAVSATGWKLVFRMDQAELDAILNATTRRLILISVAILLLGMAGVYVLTAPLLHSLSAEFEERSLAEAEVRRLNQDLERRVRERTLQLSEAKEQAEAANRTKSAFLATMSHELRTPLNAILGFAALLERERGLGERQRENVAIIRRSGEHLLALINDVLDMSKIEAGRMALEPEVVDLPATVREVLEMMQLRAEAKGLRLLPELDPSLPRHARVDARKLRQILINIVGNAIKFTAQGGVSVRARGRIEGGLVRLEFEVEDTGCGIAGSDLERVFEPFVQAGTGEGTGLGLAITRRFVRMMGGDLRVRSRVGEGSLFSFDLFAEPVAAEPVADGPHCSRVLRLAPGQPSWRVLVVDDAEPNRLLLMRLLQAVGYDVRAAVDGEQAVQLAGSFHPHFVWLDRRMAGMDGGEAARRIRALPGGGAIRIALVSASTFSDDLHHDAKVPWDAFVRKPYRDSEIFDVMQRLLGTEYLCDEPVRPTVRETAGQAELARLLRGVSLGVRAGLRAALELGDVSQVAAAVEAVGAADAALGQMVREYTDSYRYEELAAMLTEENHD